MIKILEIERRHPTRRDMDKHTVVLGCCGKTVVLTPRAVKRWQAYEITKCQDCRAKEIRKIKEDKVNETVNNLNQFTQLMARVNNHVK